MTSPVIEAVGLTFGYTRRTPLLVDVTIAVGPGEVVAVLGESGRGKSTLLYLMGLMLRPHGGTIRLDGHEVGTLPDAERAALRAREFGFVFQDAVLDPTRTVLDNVMETALYRGEARSEVAAAATRLLDDFGVLARAGGKPGQISGGQAQRIALCRALLGGPRVILADEPTGNLDRASADVVLTALRARADRGSAVLIVTHDDAVAAVCDRAVTL